MFRLLIVFLLIANIASAQKTRKADKETLKYLKENIEYLSSDQLEGRRAGTTGESLAADFIANKFKEIGLLPKGAEDSYFQPFSISDGRQILPDTYLSVNNQVLIPGIEFFPLSNSKESATIKAQVSPSLTENDQPWLIDIADDLDNNKENPHFDISNLINSLINKSKDKGASSVIFFNSGEIDDHISFDEKDRSENTIIPALYITKNAVKTYLQDLNSTYDLQFNVAIGPKIRNSKNIIGYIDNKAQLTVVLGAHFDHLGYGEDGNSMLRSGERLIHNGADDNASGTAALIELAFLLNKSKSKQFNYLFIAFSAEELGLNGSKYFSENPTISLNTVNYMINMDMVGRMNDSTRVITIGGYGTSPSWKPLIDNIKDNPFVIKYDSSGTGPSDHTSFYRKDIPVLFFFTGLHTDYHKPSDDADKINYVGELKIIYFIKQLIENDKQHEKIAFTKTREQSSGSSTRFSVSLGIMPDYTFPGNGVRVDGVSDGRPAKKAGISTGDVIRQLGDFKTSSVESYMQALSKFKKGDKTNVIILRGETELVYEIIF
jgi:hypothetical protein